MWPFFHSFALLSRPIIEKPYPVLQTNMPEFCELQYIALRLHTELVGATLLNIEGIDATDAAVPAQLKRISACGKYILLEFDDTRQKEWAIAFHLMLTGQLNVYDDPDLSDSSVQLLFDGDRSLDLHDSQHLATATCMNSQQFTKFRLDLAPMLWLPGNTFMTGNCRILSSREFVAAMRSPTCANRAIQTVLAEQKRSNRAVVSGLGQWFIARMLHAVGLCSSTKCRLVTEAHLRRMYVHLNDLCQQMWTDLHQDTHLELHNVYSRVKQLRRQYEQAYQPAQTRVEDVLRARLMWLLQHTDPSWLPPVRPAYHTWVSLILSQRISFAQSRAIRSRLYARWPDATFTPERVLGMSDTDWVEAQVLDDQRTKIVAFTRWAIEHPDELMDADRVCTQVPGIGEWSRKSFLVDTVAAADVFMHDDKYLQLNLQAIAEATTVPTSAQAMQWATACVPRDQHTLLTRVLRRLKKTSTGKVVRQESLNAQDFW